MWLDDALNAMSLTEEVEGYLLGRGASDALIEAERIKTWTPTEMEIPDPAFTDKVYGRHGEKLNGYLVVPVRSPRGLLIGFEARNIHKKNIQDFRLPETRWTPFFLGTRSAMPRIWAGGDVWICEGLFDKTALEWAVPGKDVVLATVRAKLTDLHLEFLRRFAKGWVHMCYDQDETGRKATLGWNDPESGKRRYGALEALRRVGLKCRDVPYSGGKDPGEIWDHGGVAAVQATFAK
jgi:DNA primase